MKQSKLINSYNHPVMDIADGVYLKEVGADLRIIGGVGLTLKALETTDLSNYKALNAHKAINGGDSYKFVSFSSNGENYSAFKVESLFKPISSNFEYILDSEDSKEKITYNGEDNKQGDQLMHNLVMMEIRIS